jgi:hypothetical protein
MARLTIQKTGAECDTCAHRFVTLADLTQATPALTVFVMPDGSVGVWINPEVAAKVDTEDAERMAACVRKVLLDCVRPQG